MRKLYTKIRYVIVNVLIIDLYYKQMNYRTKKASIIHVILFELTLLISMHINFELNQDNEIGDKIGKNGTQKWFA